MKADKIIAKVESKLKIIARNKNRKNAAYLKKYPNSMHKAVQIDWKDAVSLPWQVRNKQFKNPNGKCSFNPVSMEAYSYNWWLFVRQINGKIVFNDYNYSVTTRSHQNAVRAILRDLGIKIDLEVKMRRSLINFDTDALSNMYHELFYLEIAQARKNAKDRSKEIAKIKRNIAIAYKLGARIDPNEIKRIKNNSLIVEEERLQRQREKAENYKNRKQIYKELLENNIVPNIESLVA